MIKESVLFIVSTGALIYFITPASDSGEADAPTEVVREAPKAIAQPSAESWGEDDGEEEYENFTFGEPITDEGADEDEAWEDESSSKGKDQWADSGSVASSVTSSRRSASPDSPAPGELGSLDNPIVFKTNNPPNPPEED